MKNQYFGDINDYRKYGLLRVLASRGLRVGVCWMLTPSDTRPDGQFTTYWHNPARWRRYDPALFDALSRCGGDSCLRAVDRAAAWEIVPNASYYFPILPDSANARRAYFDALWPVVAKTNLLFLDPDNGVEVSSTRYGSMGSCKYLYWMEVREAFARGYSLLIYQHFPRKPRDAFATGLAQELHLQTRAPLVYSFHTAHVLFLLAGQRHHSYVLRECDRAIVARWGTQIQPRRHLVP